MLRGILQSRWFTLAIVAVIGLVGISLIKTVPLVEIAMREENNLSQKINELKAADKETEGLGDYLKSTAYLERQARLKLNYKKPDESVFFVYQKQETQGADKATMQENIITKIKQWWNNLFQK